MSEATERPDDPRAYDSEGHASRAHDASEAYDADAWATACEEDLAAEKARRRAQHGSGTGSAAEELRRLMDAVADKVSGLQSPLLGAAAQGVAQQFVQQAKAVVEPVVERNPQVFDHLAAAGNELLAAYRSAVAGHEQRWTQASADPTTSAERMDKTPKSSENGPDDPDDRSKGEHIDLD
ncbi:DUF5304 domain-containing protein [Streptomyces candidus]|uniref:DUF5304 domain-containing protein n=1 Tax=Streptomyces candidus TaxID=67283 RepID=A0A7X0HA71_9ACTN|nr:DUF5304 domain-containing protein [Streptomyces candidus]MBB6433775.1 hypothetical protein [Streptomyces candidus]GHH34631.1 hypothetical protein GCM10018773_07040 [Streptomyces candidus]